MGANIQYVIKYSDVGPIFETMRISDRREMDFIRETSESRYIMTVDLADILDNVLSELDFDDIAAARADGEEPMYSAEQLSNFDEFEGDYTKYAEYLGNKILSEMSSFTRELADTPVRVETWV